MTAPRRPRAGFTLIETIAAIVILSLAIPPMLWAVREAHLKHHALYRGSRPCSVASSAVVPYQPALRPSR